MGDVWNEGWVCCGTASDDPLISREKVGAGFVEGKVGDMDGLVWGCGERGGSREGIPRYK